MNTALHYIKDSILHYDRTRRLENGILFAVLLFIFKLISPEPKSPVFVVICEFLAVMSFYSITQYIFNLLKTKKYSPLPLILNLSILIAMIFFVLSVMEPVVTRVFDALTPGNFFYSVAATLYSFIYIAALAYMFSVFRYLFFLRQRKSPKFYFDIMALFFLFTSLSGNIVIFYPDSDFIQLALMTVTIILIAVNSIRLSWIAFMKKKEKFYLLGISVIMSILSGVNIGLSPMSNPVGQLLFNFSPSLHQFLVLMMIYGLIFFGVVFFTTLFHLPTAEAFDRKAQEVNSLMNLSRLITQVFDMKELAETVTDITMQVCNSNSAWLVSGSKDPFTLSAVRNIGYLEADKITSVLANKFSLDQITGVESILFDNGELNGNGLDGITAQETHRALAIAPLKLHNTISGYLIASRNNGELFDDDDQNSIRAFADYAAIAIENAKLLEESIEKERLEKELDVAREMQYRILPEQTPSIPELDISAVFVPAFEVGGDYYDFFHIDDSKLGFVIADVSGKGISAAFIMSEVKGIFESLSKMSRSPREVLVKANEILKLSLGKKQFVTAVYGIIDLDAQSVVFSRAGHMPVLLFRDKCIEELKPSGIGLGLDFSGRFSSTIEEHVLNLRENDIIVLYTDGITEAKNSLLDDYGQERFNEAILGLNGERNVDDLSNLIMKEVSLFSQDNPQHDDITLLIFKWKNKNNNPGEFNGRI